ncbi:hypothetical protein KGF57_000466 [Candida theae]|uniref:5-formyltetrahydrofolate cyclo-ligase n=1 Tax=Candida theae TaxID=1198502 RepID=A0AAD5BIP3_9ASCO|nr:uncharacterized protein KGF57_000466 [Candida theae]KAI5967038.1 hypothetical protein KGF57_000466 [Candida theae]
MTVQQSLTIKAAKKQLRSQVKARLKSVTQESLASQSQHILSRLANNPTFLNAKSVAVFMNMPDSEVKTLTIIDHCFKQNKKVYLPRCNTVPIKHRKPNYLSMLKIESYNDVLNLQPQGKYQLLEPISGEDAIETGDLDLILLPGVAFSSTLQRLGHGAGFYDEFLSVYKEKWSKLPSLIGLALQEQVVPENTIPVEDHDYGLDQIITSSRTFPSLQQI